MISKSIIIVWSIFCLTFFIQMQREDPSGLMYATIIVGFFWALIAVPTALIGALFKRHEIDADKIRRNRLALTCVGLGAVLLCGYLYHETSTKSLEQLQQENAVARAELYNRYHQKSAPPTYQTQEYPDLQKGLNEAAAKLRGQTQ